MRQRVITLPEPPPNVRDWEDFYVPCDCPDIPGPWFERLSPYAPAYPVAILESQLWRHSDWPFDVVVWQGECPKCGVLYQTWRLIWR